MRAGFRTIVVRLHRGRSRARFLTGLLITLGTGLMLGRVPPLGPAVSSAYVGAAAVAVEGSAASEQGARSGSSSASDVTVRAR